LNESKEEGKMDKDKLDQTEKPSKTEGDIIPHILTTSQTDEISATLCYMKEHASAESTISGVGKRSVRFLFDSALFLCIDTS
jgi:hypothetical protein